MKIKNIEMAFFMILLVVSIPLCAANAFAAITTYSLGKDNVRNYRAVSDNMVVVAAIDGAVSSASDVRVISVDNAPFSVCGFEQGKSMCNYTVGASTWRADSWPYYVTYGSEQSNQNSIIVDGLAPNVTINLIKQGQQVNVTYSVIERAYDFNDNTKCSGVKKTDFILGGVKVYSANINDSPALRCDFTDTQNMTMPSTNNAEKSFCVDVYDNVGNKGETCTTLFVDKEVSLPSNAEAYTLDDKKIDYISSTTGTISAKIKFNLNERNLASINTDASDFSNYEPQKQAMRGMTGYSCNPSNNCNGTCTCEISGITINLPEGGNPVLKMNLTDMSGNVNNVDLPVNIRVDSSPPNVLSLNAKQCGVNALGKTGNTITAVIDEVGSGLNLRKIYLDMSSVLAPVQGGSYDRVYPSDCINSGTKWICKWGPFDVTQTNIPRNPLITVVSPSQDDAGNFMQSITPNFVYDQADPVLIGSEIFAAYKGREELQNYPVAGGTLVLTLNVVDDFVVTASADFSQITGSVKTRNTTCSGSSTNQTCKFVEVGPLIGPQDDMEIPITLTDCAGNSNLTSVKLNISIVEAQANTYWSYAPGTRSPNSIDRSTLQFISHRMYFPVYSGANFQNAVPITQDVIGCNGKTAAGDDVTNYLDSIPGKGRVPELIGAPGTNLYAKFTVTKNTNPPVGDVNVNCTIRTVSKIGNVISQPEDHDVVFALNFQNSRIGTIQDEVKDKAEKVKNSWLVQAGFIGTLETWFGYGQQICTIYNIFNTISMVIGGAAVALSWIPGMADTLGKAKISFDKALVTPMTCPDVPITDPTTQCTVNFLPSFMKGVCDFVSCQSTWGAIGFLNDEIKKWSSGAGFLSVLGASDNTTKMFMANYSVSPKDSIIYSALTLCIPGIVYNLQKARQAECAYVYCINSYVSAGLPVFFCEAQRASTWCRYVWGEIFNLIPFNEFIDGIFEEMVNAIATPMGAFAALLSVCLSFKVEPFVAACTITKQVLEWTANVAKLMDANTWSNLLSYQPKEDFCKKVLA